MMACNYDEDATFDDGSCAGFPDGDCDCDGNVLDECGVCGGDNTSCSGCTDMMACNYDEDATFDDGSCIQIAEGACDCDGNVLDECGVCAGDNSSCTGCMDDLATNFDVEATLPDDDSCCYLVITSASITYNDLGIGSGTVVTEGEDGDVTIVWTDADNVIATNADSLAYSSYTVSVTDSNDCTVIVDATQTELNDIDPLAFGLFPNPTTGAITLQVSTEMYDVNMQVFDATGRVVFSQSNLVVQGSISLDFSNLSTGTYTIMLNNNNGVSVRRISIQH